MTRKFAKGFVGPAFALAMGVALSGCGFSGNWNTVEGVPLAELDMAGEAPTEIALSGPDKIEITEGDTLAITLEGDADAGAALRFDRDGDSLTIGRDTKVYDGRGTAIVKITMPPASHLSISGSGSIQAATMSADAEIDVAGSGDITVASITAQELEVDIAGSGNITVSGTAAKLSVDIAGAGDVRMGDLMADEVTVDIAGSGDVALASNGTVNASIAGSGDIVVTGSATCSLDSAGSGTLSCRPAAATAEAATSEESAAE